MKHLFDLPEQQSSRLKSLSEETGISMSQFVRQAIDQFFNQFNSGLMVSGCVLSGYNILLIQGKR